MPSSKLAELIGENGLSLLAPLLAFYPTSIALDFREGSIFFEYIYPGWYVDELRLLSLTFPMASLFYGVYPY